MTRIQKPRSCMNCRESENKPEGDMCVLCLYVSDYPYWKSRRGAKRGVQRKPGAARPGPKKLEDRGQLKQAMILSFTESDITKAGGYKKVKAELEKAFNDMAKQSLISRCMYCEKEIQQNEAIVLCKECTE